MRIEHNNIVWQHLSSPQADDLGFLQNECQISPAVLNELIGVNKRPKIEEYDNYLFLVLHF